MRPPASNYDFPRRPRHHWPPGMAHKRRFMFFRLAALFAGLYFIFLVALVIVFFVTLGSQPAVWENRPALLLLACGVPLFFVFLPFLLVGRWAFRRIGSPVAELMAATDAVSKGDLTVRVNENIPGEFGRMAHSFNNMTAELARVEQQRRNLTADIAHELRTPLHIIQGNLEGILDGVYEPSEAQVTATLEETQLLIRLVNDLQVLSLAEAGQLPLHITRFSVADLLNDVAASFTGQAAQHGVDLRIDLVPTASPLELEADLDRIDQVLSNLVANALHYTPAGGFITLSASAVPEGVRLSVADNGAGIQPDDLPYIFDRFWRGDKSRTRSEGAGSGLGLAIAKQLVQAHQGSIQVQSQPGQGTTFTVELPLSSQNGPTPRTDPA